VIVIVIVIVIVTGVVGLKLLSELLEHDM